MKKYNNKTDLANESLKQAVLNHDYQLNQYKQGHISIEHFKILKTNDLYPHGDFIPVGRVTIIN